MSGKRKLSIGITVNLENYENLKVEVEGEAEDGKDAGDLIGYLDTVLSRLGRNDPETEKRIDSYRRRVLLQPEENPGGYEQAAEISAEEILHVEEAGPDGPEKAEAPVKEEPEKEVPAVPKADTGFACSACGRPISKAEEQLSQIFMGRSLCKKCLEEMQN